MNRYLITILILLTSSSLMAQVGSQLNRSEIHRARLELTGIPQFEISDRPQKQQSLSALDFSDLLISESVVPATFDQDASQMVLLADSAWLAVWEDERGGSSKIYGQILDLNGNLIGSNLILASSDVGADLVEPLVMADTLDRIYLFYRDQSNGLVLGSRYLPDLTIDLPVFVINDTTVASYAGPMAAAVYPEGRMVIVWENFSTIGSTINMAIYSPTGSNILSPTTVNADGGLSQHWVPSVAVKPGGGFLVVWEDYRNSRADIYGALFDGNGISIGSDFAFVPPAEALASQFRPKVVFSSADEYIVAWVDQRAGQEIYLQQYDPSAGLIGSNRLVSGPDILVRNYGVDLAIKVDGQLLVSWAAFSANNTIEMLKFAPGLTAVGTPTQVNSEPLGHRWAVSSNWSADGSVVAIWTEIKEIDQDIVFQRLSSNIINIGSEILLNDDLAGAVSTDPVILTSSNWWNLVAWVDSRNDAGDIYMKAVNHHGEFVGPELRINQDQNGNLQGQPAMANSPDGALVVWVDGRAVNGISGQRIYGRYVSIWGGAIGDEFMISDALEVASKTESKIALRSDGSGLAVWVDRRLGSAQIYGQWLAAGGILVGSDFLVSNQATDLENGQLDVNVDADGSVVVSWLDFGQTEPIIKGQWYRPQNSPNVSFSYAGGPAGVRIEEIATALVSTKHLAILWIGSDADDSKVYLSVIDSLGNEIGVTKEVSSGTSLEASDPELSVSENSYLSAVWVDGRTGRREVFYQLFDDNQVAIGNNSQVSTAAPEFMEAPSTCARRGRAWFVWSDPRANGLNIFGANKLYLPTSVDDDDLTNLPEDYSLDQNYPNPFNPTTTIRYSLAQAGQAKIVLYNVLGREVVVLADGNHTAGQHEVVWNGKNSVGDEVASGVYFYRLVTDQISEQRKMVLLK